MRKFSPLFLDVNVTLYAFQKSPHISEQKGDPGGLDYCLLGGNVVVVVGVFLGEGAFFFNHCDFFLARLLWAVLLPDTILEASIERCWCMGPSDRKIIGRQLSSLLTVFVGVLSFGLGFLHLELALCNIEIDWVM